MTYSSVYLPFVTTWSPAMVVPVTSKLGAQVEGSVAGNEQWVVPGRIYQWSPRWNDCEPEQGNYVFPSWTTYNNSQLGLKQIIGTRTCPVWARLWPSSLGSPPLPEHYVSYAMWLCRMINVFNPWGIELWNEPDCSESDASLNYYGAWYDGESWVNSGVRYGEFTKVVYEYVKIRYPQVNILVGALMNSNEQNSASFLYGAKMGGLRGDYLSFHGYITERPYFDRIFNLSASLRRIVNLPAICTETSVLSWTDTDAFRVLQRDYLQHIASKLASGLTSGIVNVLWYTLANNNWKNSDLQRGSIPLPAWELFRDVNV